MPKSVRCLTPNTSVAAATNEVVELPEQLNAAKLICDVRPEQSVSLYAAM